MTKQPGNLDYIVLPGQQVLRYVWGGYNIGTMEQHTEAKMTERKVTPEEEYGKDGSKKLGGDSEVPGDEEGAPHTQEQDVGTGPVDKTSDSPPAPTTR